MSAPRPFKAEQVGVDGCDDGFQDLVEVVDLFGELLVAVGEHAQGDLGGGDRLVGPGRVGAQGGAGGDELAGAQLAQLGA
ncbi:hypothetical protein GCM10022254_53480 [Actinomadura meridiana]|uniref:Uncharacterized protein n=1 Tax=Actinomadura meridiana TaxID=559626 RepID=A0ABP8CEL6_9ACTN